MAIGWRQFDSVLSNLRQGGWGCTTDAGVTWTFPGVLEPGVFRSDPVTNSDEAGTFFYLSLLQTLVRTCTAQPTAADPGRSSKPTDSPVAAIRNGLRSIRRTGPVTVFSTSPTTALTAVAAACNSNAPPTAA